ncbi:nucleotidyltransferase domain-containing protein [Fodinisporobacter ferrooxydans]|uniref:Nucleotidyltransferase domain-containing protein n=2 Tax=Fodinisporobacter ferrooxydans TaxID=2901836 RepID=A0ABY4CPD0_9BACL|nr:nucleotidyltransferase domain-containing protein [Alicyclobacillaceae bacterium MYW30-H2]
MRQMVTDIEMKAIQELYTKIKDDLQVNKIILFGSKARGEATGYSDVDLVILTEKEKTKEDREKLSHISADLNIDYGIALSCMYFNVDEWLSGENVNPFLKDNIEKEGVEIVIQ